MANVNPLYSYRNASMGCSPAALRAEQKPKATRVGVRIEYHETDLRQGFKTAGGM